jgi:hypothetical protein
LGFGVSRGPTPCATIYGAQDLPKITYTPSYREAGRPGRKKKTAAAAAIVKAQSSLPLIPLAQETPLYDDWDHDFESDPDDHGEETYQGGDALADFIADALARPNENF